MPERRMGGKFFAAIKKLFEMGAPRDYQGTENWSLEVRENSKTQRTTKKIYDSYWWSIVDYAPHFSNGDNSATKIINKVPRKTTKSPKNKLNNLSIKILDKNEIR